jgi:hypothetical protein
MRKKLNKLHKRNRNKEFKKIKPSLNVFCYEIGRVDIIRFYDSALGTYGLDYRQLRTHRRRAAKHQATNYAS